MLMLSVSVADCMDSAKVAALAKRMLKLLRLLILIKSLFIHYLDHAIGRQARRNRLGTESRGIGMFMAILK